MGKWPNFKYHGGKWLKYDRSGFNLSHPSLGPPLNLGDPWRPLATCLKMVILTIFRHFQACRQGSPRFKGDPRDGWDELKPDWSYLSHFPPWYSKSGHFSIEIPIKNKKCLHNWGYRSIILKIIFWAPYTITHAVFRGSTDFWKKPFLGHPKVKLSLDGWMKWMGWIMRVRAVASPLSSSQSLPVLPTTTKWSKTVTTLPANWYQVSHKLPLALNIDTLMIIKCW